MAMKQNTGGLNKVEMVQSSDSSGKVVECLKQNFLKRIITNDACKQVLVISKLLHSPTAVDQLVSVLCRKWINFYIILVL